MKPQKRYLVTISLYVSASDDKDAVKIAERICKKQRDKYDNHCIVVDIHEHNFGSNKTRKIY